MSDPRVQVIDPGPELPILDGAGAARAIIWPGMGAGLRSMSHVSIGPSSRTVELRHPSEAVYYVINGDGKVREPGGAAHDLDEGAMFLVDPGTTYLVSAGSGGVELIGGPCPPDPALYAEVTTNGGAS